MLVFAHGIVGRADLPIPEALFGAAAAAVLVLSFARARAAVVAAAAAGAARERRAVPRCPRAVDVVLGALGVLVFASPSTPGLAGTRRRARQPRADGWSTSRFWVGVPFASLLFGDVLRLLSPWRAIGRAAGWVAARGGGELPEPLAYPERLGRWPAAAGICRLRRSASCAGRRRASPRPLAVLMLVYLVVMLVGMSLYGVETWTRNADAVRRLLRPVRARSRRSPAATAALYARPPVVGAGRLDAGRGHGRAARSAAIGVTAFDGASEGAAVQRRARRTCRTSSAASASAGAGARARLRRRAARRDRARRR